MRAQKTLALAAATLNLRRLCVIRTVVLLAQLSAAAIAYALMNLPLPYLTLSAIFAVLAVITLLTWWRSHQPWPVTDEEYFGHLCVDILGLTAILYFAGGASNPFVSYYLVPLCIAAATLNWRLTAVIAVLCVGAYSLLLFFYLPLETLAPHHGTDARINAHILGMWLNFLVSAALISVFVVGMATALRQREQALNQHREDQLRDEQLLAVATLAAGTAHEFGTPLSTMTVLLDEMRSDYPSPPGLQEDLNTLQTQLQLCKHNLQRLVSTAQEISSGETKPVALRHFVEQVLEQWQILRPGHSLHYRIDDDLDTQQPLLVDATVTQALLNLLNNAADASDEPVELRLHGDDRDLVITIADRGAGIPAAQDLAVGKPFVTSKGKGLGLGIFLSDATANRFGGSLNWRPRAGGGSEVELRLPWQRIRENADD